MVSKNLSGNLQGFKPGDTVTITINGVDELNHTILEDETLTVSWNVRKVD